MTQPNYLELAKQGDANAIAILLNRTLQTKGITVKATVKNGCLQIILESANVPSQEAAVSFIRKSISGLGAASIEKVLIYGKRTGEDSPAWNQDFELAGQQSSLTSGTTLEAKPTNPKFSDVSENQIPQANTYRSYNPPQTKAAKSDTEITIKSTLDSALEGLKIFLINPVGGLPPFFTSLGKQQAWRVGFVFGIIYVASILFAGKKILDSFAGGLYGSKILDGLTFKLFLIGIIHFLSIFCASALTRKLFRGSGSLEGDAFIAGTSLLSPAILFVLGSVLGVGNFEIIIMLAILCSSYTIMVLYTGCTRISKISETASPVAISVMLILSTWLNKIIITSMFL